MERYHPPNRVVPATISFILSILLVIAIVVMVHDRWSHPEVKSAQQAEHSTTGMAARNAGARVVPTDPKLSVEPTPSGPNPVQPADPN